MFKQLLSLGLATIICSSMLSITAVAEDAEPTQIYRTSIRSVAVDRDVQFMTNVFAYDNGQIQIDVYGYQYQDSWYRYNCQVGDIRFNEAYLTMDGYENKLPNNYIDPRVSVSFDDVDTVYTLRYPSDKDLSGLLIESFYLSATELGLKSNPELSVFGENLIIPFSENTQTIPKDEENIAMYELPMICDIFIDKGNGLGDYFEFDASICFTIDADGKIIYSLYAKEDFSYVAKSECKFTLTSDGIQVKYDAPSWCNYPRSLDKYNDLTSQSMFYNTNYQLYDGCYMKVDNNGDKLNTTISYSASGKLPTNNMMKIKNGSKIGTWRMSPQSTIYKNEQGELFVLNPDGTKNYFNDIVSITINGTTLSKEIGNKYEITDPVVYTEGDVNCDGEVNVTDVVLLQKWLLAVPDTHLENWQAVDLCRDNRLDVFDLCLLKRKLLEQHNN